MRFYEWELLKVSHYPAKCGGHSHCGNRNMFLVAEGQYPTFPCLNPPLLLPIKLMACHSLTHEISGRRS